MDSSPSNLMEAALRYAEAGIPVFPCNDKKKPLIARGFHAATTDPEQVNRWWRQFPGALIGVPTGAESGFVVLDLDTKHGKNGLAAIPNWKSLSPVAARTPSGGIHLYFANDPTLSCSTGQDGVDIRAEGGYVIVPGSPGYQWLNGHDLISEISIGLPEWPDSLRSLKAPVAKGEVGPPLCELDLPENIARAETWLEIEAPEATEGRRNSILANVIAHAFGDMGLSREAAVDLALRWSDIKCAPPLDASEVETAVGSAYNGRKLPLGCATAAGEFDAIEIAPRPVAQIPLSIAAWLARDLPEPDFILGRWLTTTSRAELVAPTGLGKTNFAMALGLAVAAGTDFLHWRGCGRPVRVLYIDGEMSARLFRKRIREACQRLGAEPPTFFALSHEDIPDFRPLNTPEGQKTIETVIKRVGGCELLLLDSVMCLTSGDMKEEDSWAQTMPWVRKLTRAATGQLWVHHTGHDKTRGYGTSTREWQLDTVCFLEPVERPDTDVSFQFSFSKARERTPETRADFQPVEIALVNDRWTHGRGRKPVGPVPPLAAKFFDALCRAVEQHGIGSDDPFLPTVVSLVDWRAECVRAGLLEPSRGGSARSLFSENKRKLIASNWIGCNEESMIAWILK